MTDIVRLKKLIETSLPLDAINVAAAREKSIRHGHPSTLHLWWARRPLAAARAVIFAQMVNDPIAKWIGTGREHEPNIKATCTRQRQKLFELITDLVQWENTTNEAVLTRARDEIWKSWRETCQANKDHPQAAELFNPEQLPAFHDPFAGGGALPLEAQRLGLESWATDLNPVAVLINKAMIEIPPRFAGRAPIGPRLASDKQIKLDENYRGAQGLAEDVRRYGAWMREQAVARIGHLYPQVTLPAEQGGGKATVIAWLWARTVKSPNPAFSHVDVPLVSTFVLSSKAGKETYVEPVVEGDRYRFEIRTGKVPEALKAGTTAGKRAAFVCLLSGVPMDYNYLRSEGKAGRMGQKLLAIVAEGNRGRIYLAPDAQAEEVANSVVPDWRPETPLPDNTRDFKTPNYGMTTYADLFTPRQLVALTTFSDLVQEARDKIKADALAAGMADDGRGLDAGGNGATAYAEAVGVYLGFGVDRSSDFWSSICIWANQPKNELVAHVFGRQAIPMSWDFAEANPFSNSGGNFIKNLEYVAKGVLTLPALGIGCASQKDAQRQEISKDKVISTDPPYYDNIGYADLSDYFYVWMRRTQRPTFPALFSTMAVPKAEELVATPYRHGGKGNAERFFLDGMTDAMHRLAEQAHPGFPVTIYYAFKASETTDVGTGNTGWETFLQAVLRAGLAVTGTWPMNTERTTGLKGSTNMLASSIVLVCNRRDPAAPTVGRREFLRELKAVMADALETMMGGADQISPVAPVDLAQAVIGPGMAVFSRYSAVLEADGSAMTVHTALQLINRMIVEDSDHFDADTQFALAWFEQFGWRSDDFGKADVLARAKGTSVDGVASAGVVESGGGKVRLLKAAEYPSDWDPRRDQRLAVWEALHHLVRLHSQQGVAATGQLLALIASKTEALRELGYRLYTLCERKKWADDARAYNELIVAWPEIVTASHDAAPAPDAQASLF